MLSLSYIGKNVPEEFFYYLGKSLKNFRMNKRKIIVKKICHNDILGKPQRPFYLIFAIFQSTRIF